MYIPRTVIFFIVGALIGALLAISICLTTVEHHQSLWPLGEFFGAIALIVALLWAIAIGDRRNV